MDSFQLCFVFCELLCVKELIKLCIFVDSQKMDRDQDPLQESQECEDRNL